RLSFCVFLQPQRLQQGSQRSRANRGKVREAHHGLWRVVGFPLLAFVSTLGSYTYQHFQAKTAASNM
ncbi:MAG: hypothetical protein MI976_17630, partial [Pseudomonadales bacterium]|nr:hypothetical protein [Pseudomonadales bacterium]